MAFKVGTRVVTEHGTGAIVGVDNPELRARRWVVRVDRPTPAAAAMVARFPGNRLAYFAHELTASIAQQSLDV